MSTVYFRDNFVADKKKKCSGKFCYDKRGAISSKNLRFKKERVELRIYPCPKCHSWHLTRLRTRNNRWKKRKNQYK